MQRAHPAALAFVAFVAFGAFAQAPAPVTSLRENAPPPRTSISPSPSQSVQLVVPAAFARLDDNAIVFIGGKPTAAGDVKRSVRSLDDNAIIIIGGKPTAAADLKRQLDDASAQQKVGSRAATPSTLSPWPQPPAGVKAVSTPEGRTTFGIHAIEPPLIDQDHRFVIRGIGLGDKTGKIVLGWQRYSYTDSMELISVTTTHWTSTQIDGHIASPLPFFDSIAHSVTLFVTTNAGDTYSHWIYVQRR